MTGEAAAPALAKGEQAQALGLSLSHPLPRKTLKLDEREHKAQHTKALTKRVSLPTRWVDREAAGG